MAVDIAELVNIDLAPALTLDSDLAAAIPVRILAEKAVRGWPDAEIDDARAVYIAAMTTLSLIPRLLFQFTQEMKKAKAGKAEVEFQNAISYLTEIRAALKDKVSQIASLVAPEDIQENLVRWPGIGIVGIGSADDDTTGVIWS
jgi:hypothetical protein